MSLVSVETGKTYVKSGKSSVKNGICRWKETFHESVSILQDRGDSKELEGCLFRFIVAMVWSLLSFDDYFISMSCKIFITF